MKIKILLKYPFKTLKWHQLLKKNFLSLSKLSKYTDKKT